MRKLSVAVVALCMLAGAAGCDETENQGYDDVLIVIPDIGAGDVAGDSAVGRDDGQTGRDTTAGDVSEPVDGVETGDVGAGDSTIEFDVTDVVEPGCWLGQDECQPTTAMNKMTCETAQILGRITLSNGYTTNSETINENIGGNKNDDELDKDGCPWLGGGDDPWCSSACDDDGLDHFYKVYLVPGDWFSLSISDTLVYNSEDYYGTNIDSILKVYRGGTCPLTREALVGCTDNRHDGSSNVENIQIKPVTEVEAGWYTIVIDGIDEQNAGTYSLSASLFKNQDYTGGEWKLCCDFPPN